MDDSSVVTIEVEGYNEVVIYKNLRLMQSVLSHHTFSFTWNIGSVKPDSNFQMKVAKDYIGKAVSICFKDNVFNGFITQITIDEKNSSVHSFLIEGQSPTILLEDNPKSGSWYKKNLSDIVNKVLESIPSGTMTKQIQPENSEELLYTVQYNETDFEFLCRIAKQYGEWFYYDGEKLVFGGVEDAGVELKNGVDLDEFKLKVHLQPLKFSYAGYDPFKGEPLSDTLDNVSGNGNYYQQVAADSSNDFYSRQDGRSQHISHLHNKKMLDQAKETEKDGAIARTVFFSGLSKNPSVKPGNKIKISGMDGGSDEFIIITVVHFSTLFGHYENTITGVPASVKKAPYANPHIYPKAEAQSATVKENHDTDGIGRVKVQFYWQGANDMSPWVRATSPHAGGGKGMHFIPEKGEEVLVAFEGGNAEKPYVIGSMYNGKAKSGQGDGANNVKALQSRSGNKVVLDDNAGSVLVKDKGENSILLDGAGNITITCTTKIVLTNGKSTLTMDGDTITLTGAHVDIEGTADTILHSGTTGFSSASGGDADMHGTKSTVSADAEAKLSGVTTTVTGTNTTLNGDATTSVKSSGPTSIEGAIVKLN